MSESEKRDADREAKKDQNLVSGIEAMSKVCGISADIWQRIYNFAYEKRLGTPDMLKAVMVAMKLPVKIPNEKQAILCLELQDIVKSEGFKS